MKIKNRLWIFGVIAFVVMAVPLCFFMFQFCGTKQSGDIAQWGQFGDYTGGVLNPILSVLNLIVVVYLATVLQSFRDQVANDREKESRSLQAAFDLQREWHSSEMFASREAAYEFFKSNSNWDVKKIEEMEKQQSRRSNELKHFYAVLSFFDRLQTMNQKGFITEEHLWDIYGSIFTWWDTFSFSRHLPSSWRSHSKMKALRTAIQSQADRQGQVGKHELEGWVKHAKSYMQ